MSELFNNIRTFLNSIMYNKSEDTTNYMNYYNENVINLNGIFYVLGRKLYLDSNEYTVSTTSVSNDIGRRHFILFHNTSEDVYVSCYYKLNSVGSWSWGGLGFCSDEPVSDTTTSTTNGGTIMVGAGFSNGGNNTTSYPSYHRLRIFNTSINYDLVYSRYYKFELMRKDSIYTCRVTDTTDDTIIYQTSKEITTNLPYIVMYSFEGCNYTYKNVAVKKI